MVGHHQALRRNEAGGAATQRNHRAHRVAGEVGQLLRVQLQASLLQRAGNFGQLLRYPHAFGGVRGLRQAQASNDGKRKEIHAHYAHPKVWKGRL